MLVLVCFFFDYTATTEIYTYLHTLSLHVALPISSRWRSRPTTRRAGSFTFFTHGTRQFQTSSTTCVSRSSAARAPTPMPPIPAAVESCRSEEHTSELQSLMRIS